ncbi:MAG: hypothetical protein QHH27_03290 [Clostridia bacterium]|jgi:hypothetical protein|nr:hypothetical protein [Clostridia bacterium]MDH7572561.1 hypothetical protein [Clostridia bacterium]
MTDVDPRLELLAEGLKSYPAAREAMRAFEELVEELARQVMVRHLDDLRDAAGQPGLTDQDIKAEKDLVPAPALGVGAAYGAPETWGIRWGIKWIPPQPPRSAQLGAFIGVRVSAAYKQDNVLRNLLSVAAGEIGQGVKIEKAPGWPYEVHVSAPMASMSSDIPLEKVEETIEGSIDMAVSAFLNMAKRAGGIPALLAAPAKSET